MPEWKRVERVGTPRVEVKTTEQVLVSVTLNSEPPHEWITIYASIDSEFPRSGPRTPTAGRIPATIDLACHPDHLESAIEAVDSRLARANDLYEERELPQRLAREVEEQRARKAAADLKADLTKRAEKLARPGREIDI